MGMDALVVRQADKSGLLTSLKFACAINASSAIIDVMASLTIRKLEEGTKRKLRLRAARNGRSMEQEAREILKTELSRPEAGSLNIGKAIRRRFAPLGGVELQIPKRGPIRDPGIR